MQPTQDEDIQHIINSELTTQQQQALAALLKKYRKVFATNMSEMGHSDLIQHNISIKKDARPYRTQPYRADKLTKEKISKYIQELIDNDIIEESTSPWASPIILVKKEGQFR